MDPSQRVRLLISDVDGTLLNSLGELSPVTLAAVARLRQSGIKFSLSSARPLFGMSWLIRMLQIDCLCSGLNGALLFSADGRIAAETELDLATVEESAACMRRHGLDVWLYTSDHWLVPRLSGSRVRQNSEALRTEPDRYARIREVSAPILKVSGTSEWPADLVACQAELQKELVGRASAVLSPPHHLDLTHSTADKGHAAVAIATREGAQMNEVATIGDSAADTSMFQASKFSIAMGQASEDVRHTATQVTHSNVDNGLAWAIECILSGKWFSNGAH
jgi:Cof subfamily protein (haloacid dehalogenase superfamily)